MAEEFPDRERELAERHQAQVEMEATLVSQEQQLERGTGSPIAEQSDTGLPDAEGGENVIVAGQGQGSAHQGQGADGSGTGIVSPGQGTDGDEIPSRRSDWRQDTGATDDERPRAWNGGEAHRDAATDMPMSGSVTDRNQS